jgi:prevent-host-death family protein
MKIVGAFEAKTHLNQLLRRVAKGETICITLRGVPVARLVPDAVGEKEDPRELVAGIRQLRQGAVLGKISIRELIDEGRRY